MPHPWPPTRVWGNCRCASDPPTASALAGRVRGRVPACGDQHPLPSPSCTSPRLMPATRSRARRGPALSAVSWHGQQASDSPPCPARLAPAWPTSLHGRPWPSRVPSMSVCGLVPQRASRGPVQLPCVPFVESHQCPRSTTACFYPSSTARRSSLPSPVSTRSALKSARAVRAHRVCRSHVSMRAVACAVPHALFSWLCAVSHGNKLFRLESLTLINLRN